MEFSQPAKKVMLSETDRWQKLSGKMKPFLIGLEAFLGSIFSPVITCECETLSYNASYETVSLTIPKEVAALIKTKMKLGGAEVYPFKVQPQETLAGFGILERCLCLFRQIAAEKEAMVAVAQSKGAMDLSHVVLMQFFYKYFLRLLNHWNYAHSELASADTSLLSLERNFLTTVSDRVTCGLLGLVVNEVDFLRSYLLVHDTTGSLAQQMVQEDRVFSEVSPREAGGALALSAIDELVPSGKPVSRSSSSAFRAIQRTSSFRRKGVSPPLTPRLSAEVRDAPVTSS